MSIEVIMTGLIVFSILGIFIYYRLLRGFYKKRDELKGISKPLFNGTIPPFPVPLDKKPEPNQNLNSQTGNKANNPPNNTRLSESINSFNNSVNNQTKCEKPQKPEEKLL